MKASGFSSGHGGFVAAALAPDTRGMAGSAVAGGVRVAPRPPELSFAHIAAGAI
jgi:hypothetical protein